MQNKYYAVLDTNVMVSALLGASHMSNPTKVLKAVAEGNLVPLYNQKLLMNTEKFYPVRNFHSVATLSNR